MKYTMDSADSLPQEYSLFSLTSPRTLPFLTPPFTNSYKIKVIVSEKLIGAEVIFFLL